MRIFQRERKDRNGQAQESSIWYIDFRDHNGRRRWFAGFGSEKKK